MSILKIIEDIGKDIGKGVEVAGTIVSVVDPALAPIFTEIANVIAALEGKQGSITQAQLSQIVQAIAMTGTIKQATTTTSTN